jgi:hypothetical protein
VVTVPDGYTVGGERSIRLPATYPPVRDLDFTLGALASDGDDSDTSYPVTTTVGGVPAAIEQLVLDVDTDPGVTIDSVDADGASCDWDPETGTVTCTGLPGPDDSFTLRLGLSLADTGDHALTVALRVPDAWTDSSADDTSRTITLDPVDPLPPVDASVTATGVVRGNSGTGSIDVDVAVTPDVPVTLTVRYDADKVRLDAPEPCVGAAGELSCDLPAGTTPTHLAFDFELVDRQGHQTREASVTFTVSADSTAYHETSPSDNTSGPVVLSRAGASGMTPDTDPDAQSVGSTSGSKDGDEPGLIRTVVSRLLP